MSNLKLKLKKVDPVKYGIIIGASMALFSLVIILIAVLFGALFGAASGEFGAMFGAFGGGVIMIFVGPVMYFIFGFIFGLIGTILLNFILKKTGGLDIEFEKLGADISAIGHE